MEDLGLGYVPGVVLRLWALLGVSWSGRRLS